MGEDLTLFEDKQIRHIYDEEKKQKTYKLSA